MIISDRITSLGATMLVFGLLAAASFGGHAEAISQQDRLVPPNPRTLTSPQTNSGTDISNERRRYYVQFGSFPQYAHAQSLIGRLHNSGIGSVQIVRLKRNGLHKVRSGPFVSTSSAEKLRLRGLAIGLDTKVITEDRQS